MPTPQPDEESREEWLNRCMASEEAQSDFPDNDQRFAFCQSEWDEASSENEDKININAEANGDPTRTTTLRKQFSGKMYTRFRAVKGLIRKSIVDNDALGVGQSAPGRDETRTFRQSVTPNVEPAREFQFAMDENKHEEFMDWLNGAIDDEILEEAGDRPMVGADKRWTDKWVRRAYQSGIRQADNKFRVRSDLDIDTDVVQQLNLPIHAETLNTVFSRAFSELQGITSRMSQQISRELAEKLSQGQGPLKIARRLNDVVDGELTNAQRLARTEVVRAHNEAALNRYQQLGVERITGESEQVEWMTAGDARVCPRCEGIEGTEYTLNEARGLIPLHPNCRCTWIPVTT